MGSEDYENLLSMTSRIAPIGAATPVQSVNAAAAWPTSIDNPLWATTPDPRNAASQGDITLVTQQALGCIADGNK